MSINKDVKGKEIIDCQMMIDLTAQQLFRLRLRDGEDSNELIRSDIRGQESKLIQHFSKQLCAKAKLETVPERLRQYPNQEQWLKIVGVDPETVKAISSRSRSLEVMLEMSTSEQIDHLLSRAGTSARDSCRLKLALKNLKFCTEQLARGQKSHDIDLSWSSQGGASSAPADVDHSCNSLRLHFSRPSTSSLPPDAVLCPHDNTPPHSNPNSPQPGDGKAASMGLGEGRTASVPQVGDARTMSLPTGVATQIGSRGTPPATPPTTKTGHGKGGKFPSTPPPQKKNQLNPQAFQHGTLIKSKSHESHLGLRVNQDKDKKDISKYIQKKPDDLNLPGSMETITPGHQRKVSMEGLRSGQSSPSVSSPKHQTPPPYQEQSSLTDVEDVHPLKRNQLHLPQSPRSMMHSIKHSKKRHSTLLHCNREHKFGHTFTFTSCDSCQRQMLLGYKCKVCNFQTVLRLTSTFCDHCQKQVRYVRICKKCKFHNRLVIDACDLCNKNVFLGKACKYCKQKFHRDCAAKAAPACGLPKEFVDIFIETLRRDGSPSPGRRVSQSSLPYGDSPLVHASSVPAFQPPDSGSTTSSCTSSTPSSPAPFICTPSSSSAQPSPAILITDNMHSQFPFPDVTSTYNSSPYLNTHNTTSSVGSLGYEPNNNTGENSVDVINTNTSNDSDKSDKTLVDSGTGSDKGGATVPLLERVDSVDSTGGEDGLSQSWNRVNSISVTLKEWDIPYDSIKFGDKVGEGRFGTVYKGNWHGEVAIKKLKMDPDLDNQSQLQAFKLEVSTLRKTRHENLVLFMGACMKPPNLAIVTSFCQGKTLYKVLHEGKEKFTMSHKIIIASHVAQGMGYLHAKNILHKDLKSKNVFLESGKLVITDFGLLSVTKLCYGSRKSDYLTIPPGWLCYLSPEVIRALSPGSQAIQAELPFSVASDVYAFGTVWFEILTGGWPFSRVCPESIIWQVGNGMKPSLSNVQSSKEVKELLLKCWAFDRKERSNFPDILKYLEKLPKKRLIRSPSHPVHLSRSAESVF